MSEPAGFVPNHNAARLEGQSFDRLTVVARAGTSRDGSALWKVACSCGREKTVRGTALAHGQIKSCGCKRLDRGPQRTPRKPPAEMQGAVFGKLTCMKLLISVDATQGARWLCVCECGNQKIARAKDLRSGNTKSCGCLARRGADWRAEPARRNNLRVVEAQAAE